MAVVIASNLRKELAGDLLFDGVSFKVERRDRLALSGPNGAGKTTLLRMLAGETEIHGGELAFQKGTRVALHDQRPPLERRPDAARVRPLGRRPTWSPLEEELRRLEQAMAAGDHDPATLRALRARRRRGSSTPAATPGASAPTAVAARARLRRRRPRPAAGDVLRRRADPRLARARARPATPTCCSSTSRRTTSTSPASSGWSASSQSLDAAVILVAHDRWFLEAVTTAVLELERGRSTYFAGPWHAWRREKAARALARRRRTAERVGGRHRPARALRRALPRTRRTRRGRRRRS